MVHEATARGKLRTGKLDSHQKDDRSGQVPSELEHLLVGGLVVLPVLPGLHLLRSSPERDVRVGAGVRRS